MIHSIALYTEPFTPDSPQACTVYLFDGQAIYLHGSFQSQLDFVSGLEDKIRETERNAR